MALRFDATGARVVGTLAASMTPDSDWALAFWIKDLGLASQSWVFSAASATDGSGRQLYADLNFNDWRAYHELVTTNAYTRTENGPGFAGVWKMVVFEYDHATRLISAAVGDETTPPAVTAYHTQTAGAGSSIHTGVSSYVIGARDATFVQSHSLEHLCFVSGRKFTEAERSTLHSGQNVTATGTVLMMPLRSDATAIVGGNGEISGATVEAGPTYPGGGVADTEDPSVAVDQIHGTGPVDDISGAGGYDATGNTLTVTGTTNDNVGVTDVQVGLSSNFEETKLTATSSGAEFSTWSATLDVSSWPAGARVIEARATDAAGNTASASSSVWHSPDRLYGGAASAGDHLVPLSARGAESL